MGAERVERRLMAILAADVAGYSRLVGADEEGTLAQWKAHWRTVIDPKIQEHSGRVVRITGDGLLAEFASVVAAVRCAIEVQRAMVRATPTCRRRSGSSFVWASTSATSSSTARTCGAMA